MTVSLSTGLPDIVSVQKRVRPRLFTQVVSVQPTTEPIATTFGVRIEDKKPDDNSGWTEYNFNLDRWFTEVKSHKLKTSITLETIQDLRATGLSEDVIIENLADLVADELNKDIINALDKISKVGADIVVDASINKFQRGRQLYAEVHELVAKMQKTTGTSGSYILAAGIGFNLLLGSGLLTIVDDSESDNVYRTRSGLYVVQDTYSDEDYVLVGVKKVFKGGEFELSSIVFSEYTPSGQEPTYFQKVTDFNSMNTVFGLMSRSAITTAPISSTAKSGAVEIDWDNLGELANSSPLSVKHKVV